MDMADYRNRLAALCSKREYCEKDIREKLRKEREKGNVSEKEAAEILQMLIDEKFIDNARYANAFARDKSMISGWGRDKISYHLTAKGIDRNLIEDALEYCDTPESKAKAERAIKIKWDSLNNESPDKRIEKILKFAIGRGYRYGEVRKIIDNLK